MRFGKLKMKCPECDREMISDGKRLNCTDCRLSYSVKQGTENFKIKWWLLITLVSLLVLSSTFSFWPDPILTILIVLAYLICHYALNIINNIVQKISKSKPLSQSKSGNLINLPLDKFKVIVSILASITPAYLIAHWGPDHYAFYTEFPTNALLEKGYSLEDAGHLKHLLIMGTEIPNTLFYTPAGLFWWLILQCVYSWRLYKLWWK